MTFQQSNKREKFSFYGVEILKVKTASFLGNQIERMTGITGFLFLLFKPMLFLTLKKLFKKQMKAWIVNALEWLALQTDNDIDDAIVRRVKGAMKLGVV